MRIALPAFAVLLGLATGAIAAAPAVQPKVQDYEAPGNMESRYDLGCIKAGEMANKYTPVDLYKALAKCIGAEKYREGAFIFAVAGVYGRFDTLRVTDKSAHDAVSVAAQQALGAIGQDRKEAFLKAVKDTLGKPDSLAAVCKDIRRIGPPGYYPRYMVQHGMGAFVGSDGGDGLAKDFEAQAAWKMSLDSYLHCPNP